MSRGVSRCYGLSRCEARCKDRSVARAIRFDWRDGGPLARLGPLVIGGHICREKFEKPAVIPPPRASLLLHSFYHSLGIDPTTEFQTETGRPITLVRDGKIIKPLVRPTSAYTNSGPDRPRDAAPALFLFLDGSRLVAETAVERILTLQRILNVLFQLGRIGGAPSPLPPVSPSRAARRSS